MERAVEQDGELVELGEEWLNNPLEGFFVDEKEVRSLYAYLVERRRQGIQVTPVILIERDLHFSYHQINEGYNILKDALLQGRDLEGNSTEPVFRWTVGLSSSRRAIFLLRHGACLDADETTKN
jgi:hypothetical protein